MRNLALKTFGTLVFILAVTLIVFTFINTLELF